MELRNFYIELGEDYDNVLACLGNEDLIKKVLRMLPKDENMKHLGEAFEEKNYEKAFRCAHTLKGVAANLGLIRFSKLSGDLADILRDHEYHESAQSVYGQLKQYGENVFQKIENISD